MNKVILLALLMPVSAFGQIMESFESGDISYWIQNPDGRWNCDNISAISGTRSFHHTFDNPESGIDCAGLPVKDLHPEEGPVKWSFKVRHGAEPSSSNNWAVFLLSDSDPAGLFTDQKCNGWAVGVNQTGNDDLLQLWKVTEGTFTPVIRSAVNWQSAIGTTEHARIDVERSPDGRWELKVFRQNGDTVDSFSATDPGSAAGDWFVVCYEYTSSRDRLLWIDDIVIDGIFGNDTSDPPGVGDIVISEIMADPSPAVSLPVSEYLEIYNNSQDAISLEKWSMSTGTQDYHFPPVTIGPHEYITLCQSKDALLFGVYGRVIGFQTFPLLTDGGKLLALNDASGNLIDGLEYSSDWYDDILKSEGGWSLEIIDTGFPFSGDDNWKASVSRKGGTPGSQNSVSGNNPDTHFEGITNVFPDDSLRISLSFSESVPWIAGEAESIKIDDSDIRELSSSDILLRKFTAVPDKPLEKGKIYSLNADESVTDFAGNRMETKNFRFGIPEQVTKGDIIFSELLFNPLPGGADYIEFFNNSGKIIDISRLAVVSVNVENADTSDLCFLSQENRCLLPGDYYAITVSREAICDGFISSAPGRIYEVSSMPSMNDDGGHLILLSRELDLIDEVFFDEDMHFSLLGTNEGIALERVLSAGLSSDRSLWHSASESSGWGTPGAPNSLVSGSVISDDQISLSSTRITPDNDGNQDFLVIGMKFTGNGNVVTVTVFDENGGFVKKITNNLLTGPEASVIWDCTADDETLVRSGIYILLVAVFDDKGKTRKWKKVCTVIR